MVREKIKCHRIGTHYNKPHFYILNKGRNSGKPLQEPCANCFVFSGESEEERQHYFNLCYALWQGKQFHILLTRSVIEFIRIDDLCTALHRAQETISQKKKDTAVFLNNINELNVLQENLQKQIKLIHELQRAVIHKLLM